MRHKFLLLGIALTCSMLAVGRASATPGATITVNSTADTNARDGVMTLREAMLLTTGGLGVGDLDSGECTQISNSTYDPPCTTADTVGAGSADIVTFDAGVFPLGVPATIGLGSWLPFLTTGNDTLDGSFAGVIVDGGGQKHCFLIRSNGNVIKGLEIYNCERGVVIDSGSQGNLVGGSTPADRNVISGHYIGVMIWHSGTEHNTVSGNYIGTDRSGSLAVPNISKGISIGGGAANNTIGGPTAGERNVISGVEPDPQGSCGVLIVGDHSDGNVVEGNHIGLNAAGTEALPNSQGICIIDGPDRSVVRGNVISGNDGWGLAVGSLVYWLMGSSSWSEPPTPVELDDHLQVRVNEEIIWDEDSTNGTLGPLVLVPARGDSVELHASTSHVCGSIGPLWLVHVHSGSAVRLTAGADNGCSGPGEFWSTTYTVAIPAESYGWTTGTVVEGNLVGTNAAGTAPIPNGSGVGSEAGGIGVGPYAVDTRVGGTTALQRNVISGNRLAGVVIKGPDNTGNQVIGNYVGTDAAGTSPVPNDSGVGIAQGAYANMIGGAATGDGNVIAYNTNDGIWVDGATTTGNSIMRNSIYSNGARGIGLFNGANAGLAAPAIDSVSGSVSGHTEPKCYPCTVEVFSDNEDEGRTYRGYTATNNDTMGTWTYAGPVTGPKITATITDANGNTSEFSAPVAYSPPVGGIAQAPLPNAEASADDHGSSAPNGVTLAGLGVGGALLLAAGGWYARRWWRPC